MKKRNGCAVWLLAVLVFAALLPVPCVQAADSREAAAGAEITTEELVQILLAGKMPVIDVRPDKEYAISHIPGSVNIFETEIDQMIQSSPDKSSGPVLYCNGPYCHKSTRVAEKLAKKGYTNIKRYQLGLPVWRAVGNTAETTLSGFKQIFSLDKTAVFIDARSKELFKAGTLSGAVNLQANEIEAANTDGRLPYTDHGTRIIVFGSSVREARQLAEAIAKRAYWNGSYVTETYEDLKKAGL
jgi:rhodanese-related sulfurtransferase